VFILHRFTRLLTFALGLVLVTSCCPDDEGGSGISVSNAGSLKLNPSDVVTVSAGSVVVGETTTVGVELTNVGQGDVQIVGLQLLYTAPDGGDSEGVAFELVSVDTPFSIRPFDTADASEDERRKTVEVVYRRQPEFKSRTATLIVTVENNIDGGEFTVAITEQAPNAVAQVSPSALDFGTVEQGAVESRDVSVANTGTTTLICDGFVITGHPDFSVTFGETVYPVSEITQQQVTLEEPLEVAPEEVVPITLSFSPQTPAAAQGEFVLFCNDAQNKHSVLILGNQNVPCIEVTPSQLDFGGKAIGASSQSDVQICNCGDSLLTVSSIALQPGSSADFTLKFLNTGAGVDPVTGPDPEAPIAIDINGCLRFDVEYVPDVPNPLDADNVPIPDEGTITIQNNSFQSSLDVAVTGIGIETECPVPVIEIEEGEQVVPQTVLHLSGSNSYSPSGSVIDGYLFTVKESPDGNASIFIPAPGFKEPTYQVNVAGFYTFCLDVDDDNGKSSADAGCNTTVCLDVLVIPDEAIHVELLWSTAGDLDSTDEGEGNGTDMDLHFAHQFATGATSPNPDIDGDGIGDPWFHNTLDCFWFNKLPNWGTYNPDVEDDPRLDRDDIDGWGPENLNLNVPEEAKAYHIGVHFWDDHKFGASDATVRVFIYGELDAEVSYPGMERLDMWYVGTIPWAGGTGTFVDYNEDGSPFVTPMYVNPAFPPPF
jgi:hypothetical protein